MLQLNDLIEHQDVVGDAFDEEVGAFEAMFGALEEMSEMEALEEMEGLEREINLMDESGDPVIA